MLPPVFIGIHRKDTDLSIDYKKFSPYNGKIRQADFFERSAQSRTGSRDLLVAGRNEKICKE